MSQPAFSVEMPEGDVLYTSISKIFDYESCSQMYRFKYNDRLEPESTSSNLVFGTVLHNTSDDFQIATYRGDAFDVDAVYNHHFDGNIRSQDLTYSSNWDVSSLHEVGLSLVRQYVNLWPDTGYLVASDPDDEPIVGRMLTWDLGESVVMRGKLDFLGFDRELRFGINDLKSPSSEDPDNFAILSDQLTCYQGLVSHNRELLEVPEVEWLSYQQLIKRKIPKRDGKGPVVMPPNPVPARTPRQMSEFRDKVLYLAEQIRKGIFFKSAKLPHNSPCTLCDYQELCATGSMEGLRVKKPYSKKKKAITRSSKTPF